MSTTLMGRQVRWFTYRTRGEYLFHWQLTLVDELGCRSCLCPERFVSFYGDPKADWEQPESFCARASSILHHIVYSWRRWFSNVAALLLCGSRQSKAITTWWAAWLNAYWVGIRSKSFFINIGLLIVAHAPNPMMSKNWRLLFGVI